MKEIVIKIDERILEHLKDGSFGVRPYDRNDLIDAVMNGKELPKGHGRLIDADELFDKIQFADFSSSDDVNTALFSISDAPTIIEADKGYEVEVVARGKCMMCGKELTDGLFFCRECEAKQVADKGDKE